MNNSYVHSQERVRSLMYSVFGWMTYALALTGLAAAYVYNTPQIQLLFNNTGMVIGLIIAQFALVIALSAGVNRFSFGTALVMFTVYAMLTGVMLSSIFVLYELSSIAATFFIAATMFAAMAVYGAVTDADLTSWGTYLLMALIGIIIASIVNLFLQSSAFDLLISVIGVIVFAALTAWDAQRIKQLAQYELPPAASVALALSLYLDFINLFLELLRLMGNRKQ